VRRRSVEVPAFTSTENGRGSRRPFRRSRVAAESGVAAPPRSISLSPKQEAMKHAKHRDYQRHRPPPGVRAFRASATCGAPDHPRVILTGYDADDLQQHVDAYVCPACGRGDAFRWFAASRRVEPAPEPGAPARVLR
jgi:hypothetical protein